MMVLEAAPLTEHRAGAGLLTTHDLEIGDQTLSTLCDHSMARDGRDSYTLRGEV